MEHSLKIMIILLLVGDDNESDEDSDTDTFNYSDPEADWIKESFKQQPVDQAQ